MAYVDARTRAQRTDLPGGAAHDVLKALAEADAALRHLAQLRPTCSGPLNPATSTTRIVADDAPNNSIRPPLQDFQPWPVAGGGGAAGRKKKNIKKKTLGGAGYPAQRTDRGFRSCHPAP